MGAQQKSLIYTQTEIRNPLANSVSLYKSQTPISTPVSTQGTVA